ncbi:MAG: universal stress protein [Actinomycetota bacterium]|nr:universal stress protein [Actinomycetota bacterium]
MAIPDPRETARPEGNDPQAGDDAEWGAEPEPSGAPRGSPVASPIVVGVSPVTGSRAALQWAVQEARVRRGRVRAVMVWRGFGLPGGAPGRAPAQAVISASPDQRRAELTLREFVTDALGEDHDVELRAVEGKVKDVLLREAEEAALLVVDSPAMAKLYDPSARRLAPRLIYRSPCPVVIMPPADPEADADLDDFVGEYADEAGTQPTGAASR